MFRAAHEFLERVEIILFKWIFKGYNGIKFDKIKIIIREFVAVEHFFCFNGVFLDFAVVKFACGRVQCKFYLSLVAEFVDCLEDEVDGVVRVVEWRGESAFVADVCCAFAVFILDEVMECVVDFGDHHGCFIEVFCFDRDDHEFLNAEVVVCVFPAVDDIREGSGDEFAFA